MLRCAVVGATGYTGAELVRVLLRHPRVEVAVLTTRQEAAIPLESLVSGLSKENPRGHSRLPDVRKFSFEEVKRKADVVFLALPHTEAMDVAARFFRAGKIVIDLSADFRIRSLALYEKWYGVKHRQRKLLKEAVYGLPELYRAAIQKANLIANPGCYPTGAVLGISPLIRDGLVETGSIVIDAKSGVTGAGKKLNPATQFCEINENFYAYKVNRHQHVPEMEQTLSEAAGEEVRVTFVPHLLPLNRGILSTIYLRKRPGVRINQIRGSFARAYDTEPFVRVLKEDEFPALRDVYETNFCEMGFVSDPDQDEVIVITAIDNLGKGAAGQAVQNLNVRAGFPETEGLL